MPPIRRRQFLQGASATVFSMGLAGAPICAARPVGPRETLRAGVIGLRSRGREHVRELRALDGVEVVALCDVDESVLLRELKAHADAGGRAKGFKDMRDLFDDDSIDLVAMATPNHWHALGTIWACQAGKDVYVEKPVSHNPREGQKMVEAARKYGRIVQAGTQSRSSAAFPRAFEWMREGHIGALRLARGLCYKARKSIGKMRGPQPVPESVDYDLWTGPARKLPLRRKNLHYDWHWDFETGNGDLGNQGVHQVDQCLWALGATSMPRRVRSLGGRFGYDDDGNTPNTLVSIFECETAPFVFEVRGLPPNKAAQEASWDNAHMDRYRNVGIGSVIECEGGWLELPNYETAIARDAEGVELARWQEGGNHFANFVEAVKSRRAEDLACDVEVGRLASAVCHAAHASYRIGARLGRDAARDGMTDLERVGLARLEDHLAANEVDLESEPVTVGPRLDFDGVRCTSHEEANWVLARTDRAPFVVPEEV